MSFQTDTVTVTEHLNQQLTYVAYLDSVSENTEILHPLDPRRQRRQANDKSTKQL